MEMITHSPSPAIEREKGDKLDLTKQVWEFVESQCFTEEGEVHHQNVAFWLRTLLQQNSDLVEVVAKVERESKDRVSLLESKLNQTSKSASDVTGGLEHFHNKIREDEEYKQLMEDTIKELEIKLKDCVEDNHAADLLVDSIVLRNKDLEDSNKDLELKIEHLEEENTNLREYTDNLRNDIDSLLKLASRARDTGVWDPHDLNFCEVTFEQVFGDNIEQMDTSGEQSKPFINEKTKVSEVNKSHHSSLMYDSRSSLESELNDLHKREESLNKEIEDISLRSDLSSRKIRELRQQVLKSQKKNSDQIKEAVVKDRLVADLQMQITELNREMDDLKRENDANLSVINKLKDNLHEVKTQLAIYEEDEVAKMHCSSRLSGTASLPDIPPEPYSSKFARSLTRRQSGNSSILQQLTDQLDIARQEQKNLEQKIRELLAEVEISTTEKLQMETQLLKAKSELHELTVEHDNLKDDFRTLVRSREEGYRKHTNHARNQKNETSIPNEYRTEGDNSQEALLLSEKKLDRSFHLLQQSESEVEKLGIKVDILNNEIGERDCEINSLLHRCQQLDHELSDQSAANTELTDTVEEMKQTIEHLQDAVEGEKTRADEEEKRVSVPMPVRLIYKTDSEISDEELEMMDSKTRPGKSTSSFNMSSTDSFNI